MTKEEFKREYSKWRSFMRGQGEMHHGRKYHAVRCDASDMAFDYFYNNAPEVVKSAMLTNEPHSYYELSTSLTKLMFQTHIRMNMRLPSSFRRD